MENLLAAMVFFGLCMTALSTGILLSGKKLKGSCGSISSTSGEKFTVSDSCGICIKKESDVCESSEENGQLVKLAKIGFPGKPIIR